MIKLPYVQVFIEYTAFYTGAQNEHLVNSTINAAYFTEHSFNIVVESSVKFEKNTCELTIRKQEK